MKFEIFHNQFFKALKGSYSLVTSREFFDSQITLTDFETELIVEYFREENIHVGPIKNNRNKSSKPFFLYPNNTPIELNLVFPKQKKTELRLYLSKERLFKPSANDVWFLFIGIDGLLHIGSMAVNLWNDLDQFDIDDQEYLREIEKEISTTNISIPPPPKIVTSSLGGREIFVRNSKIAAYSLSMKEYQCEVNIEHKTFVAEKSNRPYVEAHHFIPMKFQKEFDFPLDCVENILCLCPTCHRGIHLGKVEFKRELINSLYQKNSAINQFTLDQVLGFYNSLAIK